MPEVHVPTMAIVISVVVCLAVLVIPFLFGGPKRIGSDSGWKLLGQTFSNQGPNDNMVEASKGMIGGQTFGGANEPKLLVLAGDLGLRLSYTNAPEWNKFEYPDLLIPWKKFTYYSATANGVNLIIGDPSVRMEITAPGLDEQVTRFMRMNS
jgi:hypothetical protein